MLHLKFEFAMDKGPAKPEFFGKGLSSLGIDEKFNPEVFCQLLNGSSPSGKPLRHLKSDKFSPEGDNSFNSIQDRFCAEISQLNLNDITSKNVITEFGAAKSITRLDVPTASKLKSDLAESLRNIPKLKRKAAKKVIRKYVKLISKKNNRAAIDLTFSAPKSISLASLVGNKEELLNAHKEAVKFTLSYIQDNYIGTRSGPKDNRVFEKTGQMIAGIFNHGTSRLQDPQLHSHCVIINSTIDSRGKRKSTHNDLIYRDSVLLGTIYQKKFADLAIDLGYHVVPDGNGTFQIAGYTDEQLDHFSKRSAQVAREIEENSLSGSAISKRGVVLKTRASKLKIEPDQLKIKWKAEASEVALNHPKPQKIKIWKRINWITSAQHLLEKNSIWTKEKLLLTTLQSNMNRGSIGTLMTNYIKKSKVRLVTSKGLGIGYTNATVIKTEKGILNYLQSGRSTLKPISPDFDTTELANSRGFTKGQTEAFRLAISSTDFLSAWIGVAGSGKSYALKDVKSVAESNGFEVIGLAPDASSAKELSHSTGMETSTVSKFLLKKVPSSNKPKVLIIDEAGKLSSEKMLSIIKKAKQIKNARILLVGDTRQLGAVEAGSPFALLLNRNIAKAELLEHRRQINTDLKRSVELASMSLASTQSVSSLRDSISEFKTRTVRIKRLAKEYLDLSQEERNSTLVITDMHKDKDLLTEEIRKGLKKTGYLGSNDHQITGLKRKDLSQTQKGNYWAYDVGDTIVPFIDMEKLGLKKDHPYQIKKINIRNGKLTLKVGDKILDIKPPKMADFSVFTDFSLSVAPGDKLSWTKNHCGRVNNEQILVTKIRDNKLYHSGSDTPLCLGSKHYLNHSIVKTTYSSQGQTANKVLFLAESNVSKETWYVAISRAKESVSIITDNIEKLTKRVATSQKKANVFDYDNNLSRSHSKSTNLNREMQL